jgi:hypothetical protein
MSGLIDFLRAKSMNLGGLLDMAKGPALLQGGLVTDDVRKGELGRLLDASGRANTELSITVDDPRLNGGRATNIPTMVQGQTGISELQRGLPLSQDQYEIAVKRALERLMGGGALPSYPSMDAAVKAAESRPEGDKAPYMRDPRFLFPLSRPSVAQRAPTITTGIRG